MPSDDQPSPVPWYEPDMDTVLKITWGTAILGWLMVLIGIVGELLGWWNDLGEVIVTIGSILGILLTTGSLLLGAGRKQVGQMDGRLRAVHGAVTDNGRTMTSVDRRLISVDRRLISVDGKLDKLESLDVVQAKLDAQTGVLGVQLSVLEQIRDRL